tara:strand:- start:668 stop:2788 length:2121 start_codon:yes stop_codon:yes gene_type:complete
MRLIKFLTFSLLVLNVFVHSNSLANSFTQLDIPNKITFKLNNYEYNRYLRRGMRAFVDGEIDGSKNIKKKYKKWVNAKIILDNKQLNSKVRIMGDWKDHLQLPMTSLKVKIVDDTYFGVSRFNLFLPQTRNSEREVFWNLLLSYLNFPALYTRLVDVNFNGNRYRAIFQEDATKEFLERNGITETAILKQNDFEFYLNESEKEIYNKYFSSSYVVDNNNFLKNKVSSVIASEAISYTSTKEFKNRIINGDFFEKINSRFAKHGLAEINRKYIYIPHKKMYLPLYYDGMVEFPPKETNCNKKTQKKILDNFENNFYFLTNKKLTPIQKCVFQDIYTEFLEKKIDNSDYNFFSDNTNFLKDYLYIKKKIVNYLKSNSEPKKISKSMIYTFLLDNNYHKCYFNISDNSISKCEKISKENYDKLISESGEKIKQNDFTSFPINLGNFDKVIPLVNLDNENSNEFFLSEEATYIYSNQNLNDKSLRFFFNNSKSKVLINGQFENVDFNFQNNFNYKKTNIYNNNARYDQNLLTGCISFFNSKFNNVKIFAENMICEDSVNIKNSSGLIEKININNSFYDGLDLDFSNLEINEAIIGNAGNDCIDLSFGTYSIKKALIEKCSDKGISIGENSTANLKNIFVTESNIGIASKDSSTTTIDKVTINKVEICLSAYKKKKEFEGSLLSVKDFDCINYYKKIDLDKFSKINIGNNI